MADDIDQAQEIEERIRKANRKVKKKMPTKMNEFCPYCGKMITDNDNLISVGDEKHRIFACLECENP